MITHRDLNKDNKSKTLSWVEWIANLALKHCREKAINRRTLIKHLLYNHSWVSTPDKQLIKESGIIELRQYHAQEHLHGL